MYILYLRTLLSIKVLHNVLKFSHRDIKPLNIIYDKKLKILKCIDFGFICQLEDKNCKNRHQGTSKYVHTDMNKKYTKYRNREKVNFPDSISQDLFSTIITLFKMYLQIKQNGGNNLKNFTKKLTFEQPISITITEKQLNTLQKPVNQQQVKNH